MRDFPLALIMNLPTLTAMPFSFASSSVIPTDAISGSVYTQPGTTFTSTDTSFPASCSATWIPWALAAWASCAPKIRSPIAYTPGILVSNFSFTTTRPRFISGVASSVKSPSVFGHLPTAHNTYWEAAFCSFSFSTYLQMYWSPSASTPCTAAAV